MLESHEEVGSELDRLCVNVVRVLSMDAVQKANSGHPGAPMGLAPLGYVLFTRHLRHNPANPGWLDRDRFVLSPGHASMLLYSLLHLTGYDLSLEELKDFRQWGSRTPGHPEAGHTPGVETTTGPLGQGIANSVGMALAERWLAARYNRPGHDVVGHHTWAICSDGDLMEGISHETAALAGHQKLGRLIWLFDDNRITIEGSTDLASSTVQTDRFQSYGWHVQTVNDGTDLEALNKAIAAAKREQGRPSFISVRTRIAEGSPNKVGRQSSHGAPLGEDEVAAAKESLGYPSAEPFHIPEEALEMWRRTTARGVRQEGEWAERWAAYEGAHPDLAAELVGAMAGRLPAGWDAEIPDLAGEADATRSSSGKVLQGLAARIPGLIGGSADLGPSNKTDIVDADPLLPESPDGRMIHFGVREHAMGAIMNGMALHGGVRPFGGTFLIFSDYMRPSIRLAAMMGLPVIYVFTHDSIGLGEDGPTHQPVEQLMSLRAIPNLMDLRPADPAETVEAWRAAMARADGPSFLSLTRQKVPALARTGEGAESLAKGAYVLMEAAGGTPDLVLIASGSEVELAIEARESLESDGIATRVVSMASWHIFGAQSQAYRDQVLTPTAVRVAVEAGSTHGWERWVGDSGGAVGIDHFGASAPSPTLYAEFGITAESVADMARNLLEQKHQESLA
ncbi:MAG: transketolase [Gemmatimonadota bacterium]|nr:MAG: transketolase [Gemmatimonadota bacterium]